MKGSKIAITLLLGMLFIAGIACENNAVIDDFNDNATNPNLWTAYSTGPSVAEVNQRLEITLPSNLTNDPSKGGFGGEYDSVGLLSGDFDIQVDYQLIDWPSSNGVRIGLAVSTPQSLHSNSYAIERISLSNNDFPSYPREVYCTDFGDFQYNITATSDLSGKLRLVRSNTALSGYYLSNGKWFLIHSGIITSEDVHIVIAAWSHNSCFTDQYVKIAFDNFVVNKGQLVRGSPTPIPTTKYTPGPTPEAGSSTPTLPPYTPMPLPCADWTCGGMWIGGCCDYNKNGQYEIGECSDELIWRIGTGRISWKDACATLMPTLTPTPTATYTHPTPTPLPTPPIPVKATVNVNASDSGDQVNLSVGDLLIVTLDSNPSTGYSWNLSEISNTSIITKVSNYYVQGPCPPGAGGCGGYENLTFQALSAGPTTIHMKYIRPWEASAEPAANFSITVNVK